MVRRSRMLTVFGKDLDSLLQRAGKYTLREYADESGVSYKYISQLRTIPHRRPGQLYSNLLKPFTRLQILDVGESHQLSLRHRGKPLSFSECREIFPDLPEQDLVESVKQAVELQDRQIPAVEAEGSHIEARIAQSPTLSQLSRHVFVGRETELRQLQIAFDGAMTGQGALLMVAGEPGIGKTALCEQLSANVTSHGGKSIVGHCYSEKSLSLPYLAFVEVLRTYVISRDVSELTQELGASAPDLARIVLEIKEKLRIHPRPKRNPEEERYYMMEAVAHFLGNIAVVQPLLVILEDLHNADKDTLEMLTHVSRNLSGKRLLIVGTYRDVEVNRNHPLSAALAELRRLPTFGRVLLRGLNTDEVHLMLSRITGSDAPAGLTEVVYRQTGGNPLFVQEVARYLVEASLVPQGGEPEKSAHNTPIEMRIPDGLADVIGKRLSSLSESCNKMLARAAVIGREFPLALLQKVTSLPDEKLFKALEEAKNAAVIEERTGTGATVNYRFAHAFFRQTLYEEIIAPRRIRLHQQVARALEEVYENRLEEHATELAEHFSHSSDASDLAKAVSHGELAAKRAMDVYAYGEAVRLLEQAIKVQEILDPEDKGKLCDLRLKIGEALINAGAHRRVLDIEAPKAFDLAVERNDRNRASQTCQLAISSFLLEQAGTAGAFVPPEATRWAERADHYTLPETEERVRVELFMGLVKFATGEYPEGMDILSRSLALWQRVGNPSTIWELAGIWAGYRTGIEYEDERSQIASEMEKHRQATVGFITRVRGLLFIFQVQLERGWRQQAQETLIKLQNIAEQTKQPFTVLYSMFCEIVLHIYNGHFDKVDETRRHWLNYGEGHDLTGFISALDGYATVRRGLYLGGRGLELLEQWTRNPTEWAAILYRTVVLAHLGRNEESKEMIEKFLSFRKWNLNRVGNWMPVFILESAVMIKDRQVAELMLKVLAPSTVCITGLWHPTCIPRHLGGAAALLGRYDEARKYYQEAIKVCTEMRFRPELALSRLQLAELLLEHYPQEKSEAIAHLDFCIKEFREMKMQPSLERVLRHKEILKA